MSSEFKKNRRLFLKGAIALGLGFLAFPFVKRFLVDRQDNIKLNVHGVSPAFAHRIRQQDFPKVSEVLQQDVVIIGSGISALSAGRHLVKNKVTDFAVLELEPIVGGNSAFGQNKSSFYPYAAHYLPILSDESEFLEDFLLEEKVIEYINEDGVYYYNENYLCHDLKERLFINNHWQEGLVPTYGLSQKDNAEISRFFTVMQKYKYAKGNDNLPAFSIPIAMSSKDKAFTDLDQITMAEFLDNHNFHSPYLKWYVNYCCRDDYGAGIETVSAWAGIHYFASRRCKAENAVPDAILTWDKGNGFLAERLAKNFSGKIQTECLAYNIAPEGSDITVTYFDNKTKQSKKIIAKAVIVATPRFVAEKMCDASFADCFKGIHDFSYSPWLVANILLESYPLEHGNEFAWDNVSLYSPSVGYIDAGHQSLASSAKDKTLTYYLPLDTGNPSLIRKNLLEENPARFKKEILDDLEKLHPGIQKYITQIDLRVFGHAMIRPTPGVLWGQSRTELKRSQDRLFFAHSDMSGISIFEEAFWQGMMTAKDVIKLLRKS